MNVTIRNPKQAHARTVIASEAMEVGMAVTLIQGTAKGEPCQVRKATAADLADATLVKGIVTYVPDNDLAVGFIIDPTDEGLTKNTESDNTYEIPAAAHCVFWYNKPVVGFHQNAVDAALTVSSTREGTKLAFDGDSSKLTAYASGQTDGRQIYLGTALQNEDGVELTVLFDQL